MVRDWWVSERSFRERDWRATLAAGFVCVSTIFVCVYTGFVCVSTILIDYLCLINDQVPHQGIIELDYSMTTRPDGQVSV